MSDKRAFFIIVGIIAFCLLMARGIAQKEEYESLRRRAEHDGAVIHVAKIKLERGQTLNAEERRLLLDDLND